MGVSYMFGQMWEVGVVLDTKNAPLWARFLCFLCSEKDGRGGGCRMLDGH